jgi:hypothetical protein
MLLQLFITHKTQNQGAAAGVAAACHGTGLSTVQGLTMLPH